METVTEFLDNIILRLLSTRVYISLPPVLLNSEMITCLTEWRLKFTSQFLWKFSIEADQKFNSFVPNMDLLRSPVLRVIISVANVSC